MENKIVPLVILPVVLFSFICKPTEKKSIVQDTLMIILCLTAFSLPIYYAGQHSKNISANVSVIGWVTSIKMFTWIFFLTPQEKAERSFIGTLFDWRARLRPAQKANSRPPAIRLTRQLTIMMQDMIWFDIAELLFVWAGPDHVVKVMLGLMGHGTVWWGDVLLSIGCSLMLGWMVQQQLQVTYDLLMVMFAFVYKVVGWMERYGFQERVQDIKEYIEDTVSMPPLFNAPWKANSIREFWGNRWHTFYNTTFYRIAYRPVQRMVERLGYRKSRWIPAFVVFGLSGLMHEYFLYGTIGYEGFFKGTHVPVAGIQFSFFVLTAVWIGIEDRLFADGLKSKLFTWLYIITCCHLFTFPYIYTNYVTIDFISFYRIILNLYNGKTDTPLAFPFSTPQYTL